MHTGQNIFDHTLHHMGFSGEDPYFVVIGAMDGVSFDEFHGFVRSYRWSGLLVEPIPEQFRRLQANYAAIGCSPHSRFENSAIAEYDGTIRMLTIDQAAVDAGAVPDCFGGMSAIHPPRNGLASEGDAAVVGRYGRLVDVPCIRLETLFQRHAVCRVDVLCIDAEGWDFRILRQLDFARWRPRLIRCEYVNLDDAEKAELQALLDANGYLLHIEGQNLDAVTVEHWAKISNHARTIRPGAGMSTQPPFTLVTSLLPAALEHPDDAAMFRKLLGRLDSSLPLIVFVPHGAAQTAALARSAGNTLVVVRSLEDLQTQPMFARLRQAALDAVPNGSAVTDVNAAALYRLARLSEPFFLNDATLYNPFRTGHFLWIDAGDLAEVVHALETKDGAWLEIADRLVGDARMYIPCHPLDTSQRAALAPLWERWLDPTGDGPEYRVDCAAFGGTKAAINAMNGVYYACLERTLEIVPDDSAASVLSIAAHSHRHLCNLHMGGESRPASRPLSGRTGAESGPTLYRPGLVSFAADCGFLRWGFELDRVALPMIVFCAPGVAEQLRAGPLPQTLRLVELPPHAALEGECLQARLDWLVQAERTGTGDVDAWFWIDLAVCYRHLSLEYLYSDLLARTLRGIDRPTAFPVPGYPMWSFFGGPKGTLDDLLALSEAEATPLFHRASVYPEDPRGLRAWIGHHAVDEPNLYLSVARSEAALHIAGDSHIYNCFTPKGLMGQRANVLFATPRRPANGRVPPLVFSHHLGSPTLHHAGQPGQLHDYARDYRIRDGDSVVWVFGEVDVRCHIVRQQQQFGRALDEIVATLVSRFVENMLALGRDYPALTQIVFAPIPPLENPSYSSETYPTSGSIEQRIACRALLASRLEAACRSNGFLFLDIAAQFATERGDLVWEKSDRFCHLANGYQNDILDQLIALL